MEEIYGLHPTENLTIPEEYDEYHYHSLFHSSDHHHRTPMFGCDELGFQCSSESGVVGEEDEEGSSVIKAKISLHPSFSKVVDAYIDCQKVGAPPEIVVLLDEIRRENDLCKPDTTVSMVDPQFDQFMETYCNILVKYKSDLYRPFDEAASFLTQIQTQLLNLCDSEIKASNYTIHCYKEVLKLGQDLVTLKEVLKLRQDLVTAIMICLPVGAINTRVPSSNISSVDQRARNKMRYYHRKSATLLTGWQLKPCLV